MKRKFWPAAFAVAALVVTSPLSAETFRFAARGDLKSLDPYSLNEAFTLGVLGNVYEGLIKRTPSLEIVPGLAERWEIVEPTRWRFHLRRHVKFHNGEDFTADDVVFSAQRVRSNSSDLRTRLAADVRVVKIDEYTVDFLLSRPNPILHAEWASWYIVSKKWMEAHNSTTPQPATGRQANYAALHANGTGPFVITEHQSGVRTTFKPNPNWWGRVQHNFDEVTFTTISNDATRVAALISEQIDLIDPVPLQDVQRVLDCPTAEILSGQEVRIIFLGFDQRRDELRASSVKGKNPFKDVRVRKAVYEAIDVEALTTRVMRGLATPSALLIAPSLFSRAAELKRWPYDPEAAKRLLAEAGYPNGFDVQLDCPNDRYVNDEAICQAIVPMLARVGIRIDLNAQPKARFFAKVIAIGGYDTSFYLLGWTPASLDPWNVVASLAVCRDDLGHGAPSNLGGYCNREVDRLARQILVETDTKRRDDMIARAFRIIHEDVAYVPLYQSPLVWGVSKKVSAVQPTDDSMMFYLFRKR